MFDKLNLQQLKDKAEDLADSHEDAIKGGLDKAGDFVDDRTGGKHGDHIDTAVDKAQDLVGRLADQND
jgi:MT0933-like antitoxin protein